MAGTYCKFAAIAVVILSCGVALTVIIIITTIPRKTIRPTRRRAVACKDITMTTVVLTAVSGVVRVATAATRAVVAIKDKKTAKIFSPS